MKHGSLFSGIGGFDLAAEWMGWENIFHCEWNEFGKKLLKYYWPNAISYHDITKTDFTIHRGTIDILTGGFPCQPYSSAGKRLGAEDNRHLWPEMLRAIREIQPVYVVGENVRGLTNWNGGLVFDQVQADLENEGYEVTPFLLPACAVNAPHKRDRIWFVAHSINNRHKTGPETERRSDSISGIGRQTVDTGQFNGTGISSIATHSGRKHSNVPIQQRGQNKNSNFNAPWVCEQRNAADTNQFGGRAECNIENSAAGKPNGKETRDEFSWRCEDANSNTRNTRLQGNQFGQTSYPGERREQALESTAEFYQICDWRNFPTQSPLCSRNDGLSTRLDGITFPKWRNESIKGFGNAIVPQVAYQIFKAIEQYKT